MSIGIGFISFIFCFILLSYHSKLFIFCQVSVLSTLCYNETMKVGVFDSGKGGEFVAARLGELLPEHEYVVVNDREHVPYGSRSDEEEVVALTDAAIQPLLAASCDIVVIACNTATMAGITMLRDKYPDTKFVGIEPMVKPAAGLSHSGRIAVLATPLTLKSQRYHELIATHTGTVTIDEPHTAGWAAAIEQGELAKVSFDELRGCIAAGCDVIVLACTHYLALQPRLQQVFPEVRILEPSEAIARQITKLLLPR